MAAIFAVDIFKCIFMNEKFRISIQISLKFVTKGPIDNKSALVQVMVWCWTGDMIKKNQYINGSVFCLVMLNIFQFPIPQCNCFDGSCNCKHTFWVHMKHTQA